MELVRVVELTEGGPRCVDLVESTSNAVYDYATAAGQFSQINGVLAALVFAAFVFILERGDSFERSFPVSLNLLPVTFGVAILSAYQYSIVNSYGTCEVIAVLAIVAGPSFSFVILAIIASMATMFAEIGGDAGKSAYLVTVALFAATAGLTVGNVAITVMDARATFGLEYSANSLLSHTLMGLLTGAAVLLLFYILVNRGGAAKVPVLRVMRGSAVVPLIAVTTSMFVVASGVLFAFVGIVPDWASEESARAVGRQLLRLGWISPVLTGLMAGLLGALTWWEYRRLSEERGLNSYEEPGLNSDEEPGLP